MTRPHPVVGISAELPDRRGRSPYETDIGIDFLCEHEILVTTVERLYLDFRARIVLQELFSGFCFCQSVQKFRGEEIHAVRIGVFFQFLFHIVGHILYFIDESDGHAGIRKFLIARHGPKAVCQVIMLQRTVTLDAAVAAMMVGQKQSFR